MRFSPLARQLGTYPLYAGPLRPYLQSGADDQNSAGAQLAALRAFHRFTETASRSISLFLRNSGRKATAKSPSLTAHTFPGIALGKALEIDGSNGVCRTLRADNNRPRHHWTNLDAQIPHCPAKVVVDHRHQDRLTLIEFSFD